uniref:Solute carrier family 2, facilitated glucose transporter member 3 n=1 Tax=Lygus hesperus TaxID=30085 RepID=A0A0A9WZC0_LYGHE
MEQPTNMSATEEKESSVAPATKKSAGGPKESDNQKPKHKLTWMLVHSVLAAAIGSGFQHGYNAAVLNSPQKLVMTWMNETLQASDAKLEIVWSMTVSIVCIGGIVGSALTSLLAGTLGRRMTLISNNGLATLAGLMMGTAKYIDGYWLLILGRFVSGLNAGLNAGVAPMYLSEISPMRLRGSIGAMYQLVITISILIAQVLGHENVLGTECCWPMLLYLIIIPAIYQVVALFFSPDSPKYLLERGKDEKAIKASEQLCGKVEGEANIEAIRNEIAAARELPKVTMHDMVKVKKYRKPLIIMCLLMAAQQLSGINAVIYYSTDIFKAGGLSESTAQLATVGVGIVNVLVTIAGVFLVETVGRKPLLAVGFVVCQ